MFIRRKAAVRADGSPVTYLSLAHNVREKVAGGKSRPKPVIFAHLGREDNLDHDTVVAMRNAIDRYLEKRFGSASKAEGVSEAASEVRRATPHLRVLASRALGLRVIVEAVWNDLGLKRALSRLDKLHDNDFDFERIVFAMVLNRIVDPISKRACNAWVKEEAWLPELDDASVHHFYRALDLLDSHTDDILAAVGRAAHEGLDADQAATLLLDTTSSYSESTFDDLERKQISEEWAAFETGDGPKPTSPRPAILNEPPLRMRGHSKDHRPDLPQVKLGLLRTHDGRPVDLQVVAGNVHDQQLTLALIRKARERMGERRLIVVMDSGMGSNRNLQGIDGLQGPIDRVSAVPLRLSRVAEDRILGRAGRWSKHPYKTDFVYRATMLSADEAPSGRQERWVATRNQAEARRQQRLLDKEIERIRVALAKDDRSDGHGHPMCKLLANPKRKKFLKHHASDTRYVLNLAMVALERRRCGVHVVRSTLVDEPVSATLRAYDAQYHIESDFRVLKTPLKLRPMHHRASRRIKAHMLMCGLALMVVRELERRSGQTLTELKRIFGPMRATQIEQGGTRFWQRTEWSSEASALLDTMEIGAGPLIWGAISTKA